MAYYNSRGLRRPQAQAQPGGTFFAARRPGLLTQIQEGAIFSEGPPGLGLDQAAGRSGYVFDALDVRRSGHVDRVVFGRFFGRWGVGDDVLSDIW